MGRTSRTICWQLLLNLWLLGLGGCGGGYEGYKDAPYAVRGRHYFPMGREEALEYEEVGVASYYNSGWLLFPGKTAIGEKIYPWSHGAAH